MLRIIITVLFMAVAAVIVGLSFYYGTQTPKGGLLLNLGTEIMGIALTVSIVEWLFERREIRSTHRHRTVSSLANQLRLAINALDQIYAFELTDWSNYCGELRERLPRRTSSLGDNKKIVLDALGQSEKTLNLAREISSFRNDARGFYDLLDTSLDRHDDELASFDRTLKDASKPGESLEFLRTELIRITPMLSSAVAQSVSSELCSTCPNLSVIGEIMNRQERIRLYDLIYLSRFRREAEREWRHRNFEVVAEYLKELQRKALDEFAQRDIPPVIVSLANTYMTQERAAIAKRLQYEIDVRKLDDLVKKVQNAIFEETPPD